ncbi:MAG: hypothetical protein ACC645_04105, partial [Pirellulales bacterium]
GDKKSRAKRDKTDSTQTANTSQHSTFCQPGLRLSNTRQSLLSQCGPRQRVAKPTRLRVVLVFSVQKSFTALPFGAKSVVSVTFCRRNSATSKLASRVDAPEL